MQLQPQQLCKCTSLPDSLDRHVSRNLSAVLLPLLSLSVALGPRFLQNPSQIIETERHGPRCARHPGDEDVSI